MQPGFPYPGTLYLGLTRNGLPVWSQPGGPGTLVFPQQPQGEHSALYSFGCGHWFNCPEIFEIWYPYNEVQAALVSCPICSFVQQVIEPYENYQSYIDTPIVVA